MSGSSWWQQLGNDTGVLFNTVEDYSQHVIASIGMSFSGIDQLIRLLGEHGLNPLEVIPMLANRASVRGASPIAVLEEVTYGMLTQGPVGYVSALLERTIIHPIQQMLTQHERLAMELGAVHLETLDQIRAIMQSLRVGETPGSLPFSGALADSLDTHFASVSQTMITALSSGDDPGSRFWERQQALDQQTSGMYTFIDDHIGEILFLDLVILVVEVVAVGVITVGTDGVGSVLIVPVAEIDVMILGVEFLSPLVFWAAGLIINLVILAVDETIHLVQGAFAHSQSVSAPMPTNWTLPGGRALPKEYEDLAKKLWKKYANLVKLGLSASAIAYLACYYKPDFIQYLLDHWDQFSSILGPQGLSSGEQGAVNEAIALLHAIFLIGPQNIAQLGQKFTWLDGSRDPIPQQPGSTQAKQGDIDIITNFKRPWYIEVGTYNKISNADFTQQLEQLKREAAQNGAWARFYVQEPSTPISPNAESQLAATIETAVKVLDGRSCEVTIDPSSGVVTIDPPSNSVVVMSALAC